MGTVTIFFAGLALIGNTLGIIVAEEAIVMVCTGIITNIYITVVARITIVIIVALVASSLVNMANLLERVGWNAIKITNAWLLLTSARS